MGNSTVESAVGNEGDIAPAAHAHHEFNYHDRRESPRDTLQRVLNIIVDQTDEEMKRPIPEPQTYAASEFRSSTDMTELTHLGTTEDVVSVASWNSSQMYARGNGVVDGVTVTEKGQRSQRSEGHLREPSDILHIADIQTRKPRDSMYPDDARQEHQTST